MADHISVYLTGNTVPYENLAVEACLLEAVEPGECVLYLWQNRRTVVIGRNQNCWRECRLEALREDGGSLARRPSGGGAVYHDLGNLNFTFLARARDYDVSRQLEVILRAARSFGIRAEKSGRNDLVVDGRKFSGNAFYQSGDHCCHHGTILIDTDGAALARYLTPSREKLASKGVASVRSRVVNLRELNPEVDARGMRDALEEAFGLTYGLPPAPFSPGRLDPARTAGLAARFSSWEWLYGRTVPFTWERAARFSWGEIQLQLEIRAGKIARAAAFSDAMEERLVAALPDALEGIRFEEGAAREALLALAGADEAAREMARGIASLLREEGARYV